MHYRSRIGGLLVATLVTSLLIPGPAVGVPSATGATPTAVGGVQPQNVRPKAVTLISGDRITVHGNGKVAVQPRKGVHFLTYNNKGHQYVVPSDALPLLRANRLDLRLFDITTLTDANYDKRDSVPLLIAGGGTALKAVPGLAVTRQLPAIRGYAGKVKLAGTSAYWKGLKGFKGNGKVWLDGLRKPVLDVSVPQIGAPAAWAAGLDGTGVKVAVLDTGIDPAHPDLQGKILAEKNFGGEYEDELDHVGHGTHVASTIAGTGAASGGKYKGVAPGASLLDGKVCVEFGCAESWILDGMQWAADNGAQVVNMSLGGGDGPEIDPIEQAVNDLSVSHGMLFVIAAGNSGFFGDETLGSPASADAALAVGAVYKDDTLAEFSSRGPRVGDAALKPEITAPGVEIVAARSKDGFLGEPGESYMPLSGTSMATPHVAGSAAILTQQHPTWTALERKAALMAAANPNATDGPFAQGAGRVDVGRAITQTVTSNPAAVSLGRQNWPHEDDVPDARTVTYHNSGSADVTLQLALQTPAPAGVFTLSASSVTVPAGGDASVTLTSDTRNGGSSLGYLGGRVTATAGSLRVETPFAVEREIEKFGIDFVHTGRDGAPTGSYFTVAINLDSHKDYLLFGGDPTGSMRLPGGDYLVFTWIEEGTSITQLMWPRLTVNSNQTVQLDARLGGAYDVTVPNAKAVSGFADVMGSYENISVSAGADSFSNVFSGHLGPKPVEGFLSIISGLFFVPGSEGAFDSPATYQVSWYQRGSFHNGLTKHLANSDLARIKTSYAAHAGEQGLRVRFSEVPDSSVASGVGLFTSLPFSRDEYVTTDTGWYGDFEQVVIGEDGWPISLDIVVEETTTYQPGKTYTQKWNRAPYGVGYFSTAPDFGRYQDTIFGFPSFASDADGRPGWTFEYSKGRNALYRNGELVEEIDGDYGVWEVPGEKARYRLESSIERAKPFELSTKVSAEYSFDSATAPGEDVAALPVTAIGFTPSLDANHSSPRHSPMVVPLAVRQQANSGAGAVRKLTIEVSTNDGASWTKVPVINLFGQWYALYANPGKAGFVSYRASVEDSKGNTAVQTIIRAYKVK